MPDGSPVSEDVFALQYRRFASVIVVFAKMGQGWPHSYVKIGIISSVRKTA
jgi:hypothetical protein